MVWVWSFFVKTNFHIKKGKTQPILMKDHFQSRGLQRENKQTDKQTNHRASMDLPQHAAFVWGRVNFLQSGEYGALFWIYAGNCVDKQE